MSFTTWIKGLFGKAETAADKTKELINDGKEVITQTKEVVQKLRDMDDLTLENV